MADKPTEGGSDTPPAPRRARKPRTASTTRSSGTAKRGPGRPKAAVAAAAPAPAKAARTPKPAATKSAAKAPRKASAAKAAKPSTVASASPAARVAKSVQNGVAAVTPSGKKKFAAIAALAGIAAGIATVFGRRKISKAATEAIDAVSGKETSAPSSETTN
jgi:hypothetical protein